MLSSGLSNDNSSYLLDERAESKSFENTIYSVPGEAREHADIQVLRGFLPTLVLFNMGKAQVKHTFSISWE